MTDISRKRKFNEKKTVSVASASVRHDDVADTAVQQLFKIPGKCLFIDSGIVVETASQAGVTANFGFDGGTGVELGSALSLATTGYRPGATVSATHLPSGTGKTVTATFSADPTVGIFHFIVMFIEYTLGNAKLLNYA